MSGSEQAAPLEIRRACAVMFARFRASAWVWMHAFVNSGVVAFISNCLGNTPACDGTWEKHLVLENTACVQIRL